MVEQQEMKEPGEIRTEEQKETPVKEQNEPNETNEKEIKEPEEKESSDEKKPKVKEEEKEKGEGDKKEKKKEKRKGKSEVQKLKEEMERLKQKYEKELKKKEQEIEQQKEKYLYLAAELDNARKHFKKQADRDIDKAIGRIIEQFLPLIESFEKALELKEQIPKNEITPHIQAFLEGFENIYQNFNDILNKLDVKPIDETGIKFDYRYHEVMMKIENPDIEDNTVVQILQKGYLIGNKVLRPAKVIVSRKPKPPEPKKEKTDKEDKKAGVEEEKGNKKESKKNNERGENQDDGEKNGQDNKDGAVSDGSADKNQQPNAEKMEN